MTFDSRFSPEERAKFADCVLNGQQTVRQIAEDNELSRKTVQNWVERRRTELGVPAPPRGGGEALPTRAVVRIEKAERARAEAERRAESAESRVMELEAHMDKLRSGIGSLKGTLQLYMYPDFLDEGPVH